MDADAFPTAIVPTRPEPVFVRFDKLARQFGDPMAKLFSIQSCGDAELEFRAAAELMPYRYPRLKSSETVLRAGDGEGGVNIVINFGTPQPPTIDVTPAVDPLA